MPSINARVIRRVLRRSMKSAPLDERFVPSMRRRVDGAPVMTLLGRGVSCRPLAPGDLGTTEGEWVGVPDASRHLLYFHGGYFIAGQTRRSRNLAARLSTGLSADVVLVRYRLAPEHPHPAALDDALDAYRSLLGSGVDPASIAIAGDSAGGGLALAMLLRAKGDGMPMPAAAVLLSPWTDLTCASPSVDGNDATDDMISAGALRRASSCYAGSYHPSDPALSPLFGELSGLPPLFVTVDISESLLDDSVRLVDAVLAAGGRAELRQSVGLFHVWPIVVPFLAEARSTLAEIITFLDEELA